MSTPRFDVTTLGTGAALPARGRYPTAQLLNIHEALYLVDCGEGTQERLRSAGINMQRIGHIFISHLHGDHYLGLMGLISSMHLMGRQAELHVYAAIELKEIIELQMRVSGTYLRFSLEFHPIVAESGTVILENVQVSVSTLALKHRIPCVGFVFRESLRPRSLRKERVDEIPHYMRSSIKQGADLELPDGSMILNTELTEDPPPPRSYAYCSDTAYEPALIPFLRGVDLLYHEATFTSPFAARAKETMHSTAAQAAQVAKEAGVGQLLLGHFSSRYKSAGPLLQEAIQIFPNTLLSYESATFPV
ncbi:MAG: ribonuclease Z [Flavobacteriales bacterium]|nr:ribonuclease Z [Flavobacteriales bacterium]